MPADFALKLERHRRRARTVLYQAVCHARKQGMKINSTEFTNVLWYFGCFWCRIEPWKALDIHNTSARMARIIVYQFLQEACNYRQPLERAPQILASHLILVANSPAGWRRNEELGWNIADWSPRDERDDDD